MVLPWFYHGYTMVIPWLYHVISGLWIHIDIFSQRRVLQTWIWHFGDDWDDSWVAWDWTMLGWWKRRWNLSGPVQPFFAALGSKGIGWGLSQRLTHEFPLGLGKIIQKNPGIGWMFFVDGWNPDDLGWKPLEVFTAKFATESNPWIGSVKIPWLNLITSHQQHLNISINNHQHIPSGKLT